MSDPVTNVEIEDVLSSIRKLVAEEARAPLVKREKTPEPDKLVLTPAQRIDKASEIPSADEADIKAQPPKLLSNPVDMSKLRFQHARESGIDDIPGETRLSEFGAVEGRVPDDQFRADDSAEQDDTGKDEAREKGAGSASRSALNRLIEEEVSAALNDLDSDPEEGAAGGFDLTYLVEDDLPPGEADMPEPDPVAEDNEAPFWADVQDTHQADVQELPVERASAAEQQTSLPEQRNFAADHTASVSESQPPASEQESAPKSGPPQSLEEKVAALSRLVTREPDAYEEDRDDAEQDTLSASTEPMAWPELTFSSRLDKDRDVTQSPAAQAEASLLEPDSTSPEPEIAQAEDIELPEADSETAPAPVDTAEYIDEEVLREMVVSIVRSELQGALGEKITRNVRKLVRREIHRMLISQDFD